MAILWLPFYDLGGSVTEKDAFSESPSLDARLYRYLTGRVWAKIGPRYRQQVPEPDASLSTQAAWFKWWFTHCALPPQTFVGPHAGPVSLMRSLNELYRSHYPDEYLVPPFTPLSQTSGQLTTTNLPGHMTMVKGSRRSPWFQLQESAKGPVRELPFYDLSAPFGTGQVNKPGDQLLVSKLVRLIKLGLPQKFPEYPTLGPMAVLTPQAVGLLAKGLKEAGWMCNGDEAVVQPSYGSTVTTSLIRGLNHFAYQASLAGTGLEYLHFPTQANLGTALVQDFAANVKTLM